jgi:hypothetical protein
MAKHELKRIQEACAAGDVTIAASDECLDRMTKNSGKPGFTVTAASVECFEDGFLAISWESVSAGFGQVCFELRDDGLHCDDECMGREFVADVLLKLLESAKLSSEDNETEGDADA